MSLRIKNVTKFAELVQDSMDRVKRGLEADVDETDVENIHFRYAI